MTLGWIHKKKYELRVAKKWRRIGQLLVKKYLADQLRDDRGRGGIGETASSFKYDSPQSRRDRG
jgi:hypothetical protein